MYDDHVAANAAQETAQPSFATEEPQEALPEQPGPAVCEDASAQSAVQDAAAAVETTRAFSERLKAVSGRRVDEFIAGMGLQDHTGAPIRTRAQYDAWQAAKAAASASAAAPDALQPQNTAAAAPEVQAEQACMPEREFSSASEEELSALRSELHRLQDAERDRALLADPAQGAAYALVRDKVQQLQQLCRNTGDEVSLDAAYAAVLLTELPALCRDAAEKARSEVLRTVQANGLASPGALGDEANPQPLDFDNMSSADFAEYHRRALRGEWS
ncbi:MAG: hypothetical protein IJ412_01740 [Oscillospiraceae bacterium]|nr:hypothetical protein [Oscillospiraceae bacterium]